MRHLKYHRLGSLRVMMPIICSFWMIDLSCDAARADEGLSVKAMTFNIRYNNPDDGPNRWSQRRNAVVRLIQHTESDFVGIQEALPDQVADLLKGLPEYHSLGRSREIKADRGEATLILYRHKRWRLDQDRQGWFWLSDTPEKPGSITWGNACPRMVAWGRFIDEKSDRGVYIFNTHFDHVSELSRQKGAELLAKRIDEQAKSEPVVVLGDFNSGESSEAISYLLGKKDGSPVKLVDTFRAIHPDEKQVGTFHDFHGGSKGEKIDFILASPGVMVHAAEIMRDPISGSGNDARYPSDHYPVRAEMSFHGK